MKTNVENCGQWNILDSDGGDHAAIRAAARWVDAGGDCAALTEAFSVLWDTLDEHGEHAYAQDIEACTAAERAVVEAWAATE